MKNLILIIFITVLAFGCQKERVNVLSPAQILFQCERINFAWGKEHNGWLIDSAGNVYTYELPENWNIPDSTQRISENDMLENLSKTQLTSTKIDKSILKEKVRLINNASKGPVSEPHNSMNDFGAIGYYTFIYDKENKQYKYVILNVYGDWSIENRSPEANNLYKWLMTIKPE